MPVCLQRKGDQPGNPPSDFWKVSKFKKKKEIFQILIQEIKSGLKWSTLKFSDAPPPFLERIWGTAMFEYSFFNVILIKINGKRVFRTVLRLECSITIEGPAGPT
jgi:hypothetical protein